MVVVVAIMVVIVVVVIAIVVILSGCGHSSSNGRIVVIAGVDAVTVFDSIQGTHIQPSALLQLITNI